MPVAGLCRSVFFWSCDPSPLPRGDRLDEPGLDELVQCGFGDPDVPWPDPYEADAPLFDQPPGEELARVEQLGGLGDGQQPFGWRMFSVVSHAALPVAERSGSCWPLALARASVSAACHFCRSAMMCRSRCAGGMWSGSPGVTGSQVCREGSVAGMPSVARSQSRRSALWSARVLPDHLRETRTRRPA